MWVRNVAILDDRIIRKTKHDKKMYRQLDTHGLVIQISPTGSKLWRYRYRFADKKKMLALAPHPDVSLAEAKALAGSVLRQDETSNLNKVMGDHSKSYYN